MKGKEELNALMSKCIEIHTLSNTNERLVIRLIHHAWHSRSHNFSHEDARIEFQSLIYLQYGTGSRLTKSNEPKACIGYDREESGIGASHSAAAQTEFEELEDAFIMLHIDYTPRRTVLSLLSIGLYLSFNASSTF